MKDMNKYLIPTEIINCDDPVIVKTALDVTEGCSNDIERAVKLFYYVRDSIPYNPYVNIFSKEIYVSSNVLNAESSFCVPKAVLLASLARSVGIPSRLGFANIRNHLMPEKMKTILNTDVIYGHGFTELFPDNRFIKATPAFDIGMCKNNDYNPVEFDGISDAIFPSENIYGEPHIEYIEYTKYGDDLPFEWLVALFDKIYGDLDLNLLNNQI